MRPTTEKFQHALRETHSISVAAYVFDTNDPYQDGPIAVDVIGGSVTMDRDAQIRRQATLEVAIGDQTDLLSRLAFGGYATIERGVRFADGTVERVQLGRFRVESVVWSHLGGTATLTLADRMAQIIDERFSWPWVPAGFKAAGACHNAVQQVFGDTILYHMETPITAGATLVDTVFEEDRAAAVNYLAAAVDSWAFFDFNGDFVLRPRTAAPTVAFTFDAGDRGVLIAATETLDRSSVRNAVVVKGQASADQPTFAALALHTDPSSPTRWGGPMGRIVSISSNAAIASQAQADDTARSLLNLRLGLQRTVTLSGVANPMLEPDDLVDVVFPDGREERMAVNAVTVGLGVDATVEIVAAMSQDEISQVEVLSGEDALRELERPDVVVAA